MIPLDGNDMGARAAQPAGGAPKRGIRLGAGKRAQQCGRRPRLSGRDGWVPHPLLEAVKEPDRSIFAGNQNV